MAAGDPCATCCPKSSARYMCSVVITSSRSDISSMWKVLILEELLTILYIPPDTYISFFINLIRLCLKEIILAINNHGQMLKLIVLMR
jgi:hypothetical protein